MAATAAAETALSGALGKLFAVVEAYPTLKATGNVAQLQEELTSTENKIAFARQLYNDTATEYNTKQRQFPTMLVAGLAGAAPAELWEITDGAERENVTVNLSMPSPAASPTPRRRHGASGSVRADGRRALPGNRRSFGLSPSGRGAVAVLYFRLSTHYSLAAEGRSPHG